MIQKIINCWKNLKHETRCVTYNWRQISNYVIKNYSPLQLCLKDTQYRWAVHEHYTHVVILVFLFPPASMGACSLINCLLPWQIWIWCWHILPAFSDNSSLPYLFKWSVSDSRSHWYTLHATCRHGYVTLNTGHITLTPLWRRWINTPKFSLSSTG